MRAARPLLLGLLMVPLCAVDVCLGGEKLPEKAATILSKAD